METWLGAVVLTALAFVVYANSLRVPFFFDDPVAILENPTIRDLGNIGQVLSPPTNGSGVTGRPIVNLSLAVNYALSGTKVAGYHVTNIAIHALAGLLLFGCVRRTLRSEPLAALRPSATRIGFVVAALWMLHPLQTESVTCVIQRTELLVGLFFLLTLYCFIRAAESSARRWAAAAIAACALGMASKEVMVTAPVIVFLHDRTFFAGSFAHAWRLRWRLHSGLAAGWLVLVALLISIGGRRGQVGGFDAGVAWWSYALKQAEAIVTYLRLTAWPHPLNVFHGVELVTNPADVWLELLVITLLATAVLGAAWRKPVLGFCGLWFFGILAPSSSIVPLVSQTVSEHRMYLPLAAPSRPRSPACSTPCPGPDGWRRSVRPRHSASSPPIATSTTGASLPSGRTRWRKHRKTRAPG